MNLRLNRRELLGLIGAGAAAGLRPSLVSGAKGPEFPQRAVVRTILKNIRPSELGNGVTLFHEHLPTDIARLICRRPANARPIPPPIAVDLMVEEVKAAQKDGITCIVDGGHDDMGRDRDALKQIAQLHGGRAVEGPLYGRTKTVFAPKLVQAGVKEETVHAILYDNPRRFLAFVPKKS